MRHDALIEQGVQESGGSLVRPRGEGDSRFAVFPRATDAVVAAAAIQRAIHAEDWQSIFRDPQSAIRIRMALHTGEADLREGDYYGSAVNRCARLRAVAYGGQTLVSQTTADLVRDGLPDEIVLEDLGVHMLKDLQRPERIYQVTAPGLPRDFPPLKTLEGWPNNLPSQATPLIGREKEVEAVAGLLRRDNVRIATLTGPGGTGKTRLSLQAAANLVDEFRDGAYFVPLAPITDASLVLSTIAHTLGLQENAGGSIMLAVSNYLRDKELLLILDNFEQIMGAAQLVSALIAAAPRLKVLVTSREVLRLYGEHDYPVPPLGLPPTRAQQVEPLTAESLSQYEAVRLFIERATSIKPSFAVTNDNAPAVAEICWRLDGLPLAIELAAARIAILTPQAMLARLQSRLKLLTSGARDLPARQQTLRGAIEWSYDLLDEGERVLFRRMSVFVGGCSFEAVESVCNADGDLPLDTLDGIASLVGKSLIRQMEGVQGEPRFWMLETIREYGLEQLGASGDAESVRQAHALYFRDFAEQVEPELYQGGQIEWSDRLEADNDNLRAALSWAIEHSETETALRIPGALWHFWQIRGYLSEGYGWCVAVLNLSGAEEYTRARAKALFAASLLAWLQSDSSTALTLAEESASVYRVVGDRVGLGLSLTMLGLALALKGEIDPSNRAMEEGVAQFEGITSIEARWAVARWSFAYALNSSGLGLIGDAQRRKFASERLAKTLDLYRQLDDIWGMSQALNFSGDLARIEGDFAAARQRYEESLALYRRLGAKADIPASLHNQGYAALGMGDVDRADALFREALDLQMELGNNAGTLECLGGLAAVLVARGDFMRGARLLGSIEALREKANAPVWPAERADMERSLAALRQGLDAAAIESAWAEGRKLTLEETLDLARAGYEAGPPRNG